MRTGFKDLDKIINIGKPQLILLTGNHNISMLSGDIMFKTRIDAYNNTEKPIGSCKLKYDKNYRKLFEYDYNGK